MEINILTLFPEMFVGPLSESIIKRAIDKKIVKINYFNLREYTTDKHKTVDDTPCGGGAGMVLKVDIVDRALEKITKSKREDFHVILMTPQGKTFNQNIAQELTQKKKMILICGHYEGFDERIREHLIDEEISLGDFVLTGGEIAAMAITDAVVRLLPGALGKDESSQEESFSLSNGESQLLEYPIYTRPVEYKNWEVPTILLSGDHKKIKDWRLEQALERTKKKRPDLLK